MIKSKTKNRVLNAAGNDKNNGEFNEGLDWILSKK
jgi:hypothetical protein